jgi:hypothetical protein
MSMKRACVAVTVIGIIFATGCKKSPLAGVGGTKAGNNNAQSSAGNLSLQSAYDNVSQATQKITKLLNGVKDDASAQAAAGPLRLAAAELAAATKQLKQTVAALDAAGQKQQIVQFYQKLAEKGEDPTVTQLRPAIERVVNSQQGPRLRSEINAVLDAMMENASVTEREHMQHWIQEKNLRQ